MLKYPWVGGSWSLRNARPEVPWLTAVEMVQNKELVLGQSCKERLTLRIGHQDK